jgi:hypothetical protein
METKNMTTSQLGNSVNLSPLRHGSFLIPLLLACFALAPTARAVTPAPDGGYPGENTAEGEDALFVLTTGSDNTANGFHALLSNTTGINNTATGADALKNNNKGRNNTANGRLALLSNTTGSYNTANGGEALFLNTTGSYNTANGHGALYSNNGGSFNTANGLSALLKNTTGHNNTASGFAALYNNLTGFYNTANGVGALTSNTTGAQNTAEGFEALLNSTGSNNIALGFLAGNNLTTGSNNIDIGAFGAGGESNTIRIGKSGLQTKAFMQGISGVTVASGVGVIVNSSGQLGTVVSAARFKDEIKPMDKASEAILALKPVTFRYKPELDPDGIPQFGLVAEQVEKVNPDLVARDDQGKVYTVRYEAVNAMLLNEFLKAHRIVEELKSKVAKQEVTIAQQQKDFQSTAAQQGKEIKALTASLKEQAAQIQKVSAQLEVSKPAAQIVDNNQ